MKFMTPQAGKQTIAIQVLPDISRNKSSQTMEFGKLIKHNITNISPEKSNTNCNLETIPRPFLQILEFSISLDQ